MKIAGASRLGGANLTTVQKAQLSAQEIARKRNPLRIASYPTSEPYVVIDNGCEGDGYIGHGWVVVKTHYDVLVTDSEGRQHHPVDAVATILKHENGVRTRSLIARVNRMIHKPHEQETLLPPDKLRWNDVNVDDKAIKFGGTQRISGDGWEIPLWWTGETYWFQHTEPNKAKDPKKLAVARLTSPLPYKPKDFAIQAAQTTMPKVKKADKRPTIYMTPKPGAHGDHQDYMEPPDLLDEPNEEVPNKRRFWNEWTTNEHRWKPHQLAEWSKRLCGVDKNTVKKTFAATTQLVPSVKHENETWPKDHHAARFPLLKCRRLKEIAYCDVVEYVIGSTKHYAFMVYCSTSQATGLYALGKSKSVTKTVQALLAFTRDFGLPKVFYSDFANDLNKSNVFRKHNTHTFTVTKLTEADHQNSNLVERKWQDIKHRIETIMRNRNVPKDHYIDLAHHVVDCHNHTALQSLNWRTPLEAIDGETPDISVFRFYFWEPVWYLRNYKDKQRVWVKGRFLGIAWNTGDSMCFEVCPEPGETQEAYRRVHRSLVIPRDIQENGPRHLRKLPSDYYFPTPIFSSSTQLEGRNEEEQSAQTQENGKTKGKVQKNKSNDKEADDKEGSGPGPIEADLRKQYLEAMEKDQETLNQLLVPPADILDSGYVTAIKSHRVKFNPKEGKDQFFFTVETDSGETMKNLCISTLKVDAPLLLAGYIKNHKKIRGDNRWKEQYKWAVGMDREACKIGKLTQELEAKAGVTLRRKKGNFSGVSCSRQGPVRKCRRRAQGAPKTTSNKKKSNPMGTYQYGVYVPRSVKEALEVDKKNGNNLWQEGIVREIKALMDLKTFSVIAKSEREKARKNSQFAPLRMLFCVKQDGRRKARLVIGGHVVDATGFDTFASNMKTISARLLMLIASANKYDVLAGDIGNAYLWAKGDMPIITSLGKEFEVYDKSIPTGSLAVVEKALYGLPTSANRWHAMLADTLRSMGFKPTRYDPDVWYKPDGKEHYEYIGTHTDDVLCVGRNPRVTMEKLRARFSMKTIAEPEFHLGCDYRRNEDGSWSVGTKTYVQEALKRIAAIVGKTHEGKPALGYADTPMVEKYHPELDKSDLLSLEDHRKFQQLIGTGQWLITIGRYDLTYAVSSLSRFSAAPRTKHLEAAVRIFQYLNKKPEVWTKFDPSDHKPYGETTSPYTEGKDIDWKDTYPDAFEEIDQKCPNNGKGKSKAMSTTVYFDSNYAHDEVTRRSITGIVTFVGNTPVSWLSKRQGAIATSTYSAELCAARMACEEAISIRYMLRSLGVPIKGATALIGDNYGSMASVNLPASPCKKKASAIAFHYVRECNAAGIIKAIHIPTDFNLADGFTKALGKNLFWNHMNMLCPKGPWNIKRSLTEEESPKSKNTKRRKRRRGNKV